MKVLEREILIIGAGPAGLSAAIEARRTGADVLVVDENSAPGGQLFKQIHRFFGSAGFRPCFTHLQAEYTAEVLGPPHPGDRLTTADAAAYNRARNALLLGLCRVCYSDDMVRFQEGLSRMSGGALCLLDLSGRPGCAAVECSGGTAICKELLTAPGDELRGAALIRSHFGSERCQVRVPPGRQALPGGGLQAFGMVKWYREQPDCPWVKDITGYMGLGFD